MLDGKSVLITGGTGSFGHKFTEMALKQYNLKKLIIFSRDEYKQYEMAKLFPENKYEAIRYFIGDVRDKDRLHRAFQGVDYVVHAAALKQVPALEYNPTEAVRTNVDGANNVVDAAIDAGVKKVIALSTDKAVSPANLYGATKLVAEKLFIAANSYSGGSVKFSAVRYGNVVGSRGSVIPFFIDLRARGVKEYPITDERMTRFWITLEQGVELVLKTLDESVGGEIFIPKMPSMRVTDLAKALDPNCVLKMIGIRPGEKIHESLISEDEARKALEFEKHFIVLPQFMGTEDIFKKFKGGKDLPDGFIYRSDLNKDWLDVDRLKVMVNNWKMDI
ncbi:MAG: UDP-N-acetylglucosamine 4,6-dehydratase (inverting) [Candidatus Omnitrophica bacterium]|nr:UDP-N-acetylglucosamine 4,6-dehydratase (inverting) [Candidatus Omnitrophota bacterium]